jgi:hypothetical protein
VQSQGEIGYTKTVATINGTGFQGHAKKPWGSRAAFWVETQLAAGSRSHNGIRNTPWLVSA